MLHPHRTVRFFATSAALALFLACTTNQGTTSECTTDADCAGDGLADTICRDGFCRVPAPTADASSAAPADPTWGCLGQVPNVTPEPSVPVNAGFKFLIDGDRPLTGMTAIACSELDVDCATPTGSATINATGEADVAVFSGFRGYIKIAADESAPKFFPMLAYALPVPDKTAAAERQSWALFRPDQFSLVSTLAQGPALSPDAGHIIFLARTCDGKPAEDVAVTSEPNRTDTTPFYTDDNNVPSITKRGTSKTGVGGIFNLPPGMVTITVRKDDGTTVSTRSLLVRAGTITYAALPPS